ncbi:MAG TPA: 2-hydroxyacyl-CoA dehydratase family protein [Deltaproteobacteria bacterium]|nr:2-hydroxyacyl-CoA dehydratase family protein [Deltaproteobacteria bacterium]
MKRETREYHYDWNIWSIIENASRTGDGTRKEYDTLLKLIPHFRDSLDAVIRWGEPGTLLLKLLAQCLNAVLTAHEQGKKVALTTFCFAPPILHAFDVVPLVLEPMTVLGTFILQRGTGEYLDYCCEVGFTETSCSSQRGALGAYLAGLGVRPDFIICDSPGICDTNANSYAFASAYLDIPFYQLNYPPFLTGERASAYHRQDFRGLISFLEEQTGHTLGMDRLRQITAEIRRQSELITEINEFQRIVPSPVPGIFNLFLYSGNFLMGGTPGFTDLLESMLKYIRGRAAQGLAGTRSGKERARGFFSYIDHYTTDLRFWTFLENRDISHLGCILSTFWQEDAPYSMEHPDAVYRVEDGDLDAMIDSLAMQVSRMPMIKSIRGPYDAPHMWLDDTLTMTRLLRADFVAYFGTIGCRNTWGMVKPYARDLERAGIPALILYADAFDDRVQSWDAVIDKMQEFLSLRKIGTGRPARRPWR